MQNPLWRDDQGLGMDGIWRIAAPFPVWLLHTPRIDAASLTTLLSDEERARAGRFRTDALRNRYVAAHAGLRRLIERQFGVPAAGQLFTCNELGKPSLLGRSDVRSNISYSGDYALIGLSQDREIGVDLEAGRPIEDALELAAIHYTPRERSALQRALAKSTSHDEGFLRVWVRKEACVKALGQGLSIPLDTVECGMEGEATTVKFGKTQICTGVVHLCDHVMNVSPGGLFMGWARI